MAHVLIAFADPNMTEVPAIVCDGAGYTCDFAQELEAAEKLKAGGFDLVLLLSLKPAPLARALRAVNASVPLIAIVNELAPEDASATRKAGVSALVYRPYSIQTLRKALADELSGSRSGSLTNVQIRQG